MKKITKTKAAKTLPTKKPQATERHLRHEFNTVEQIENAKQLGESLNQQRQVEADFDRVKGDFKARSSSVEARIGELRDKVTSGYELRNTKCEWRFDEPKAGQKTLYRLDTETAVESTDMTVADKQAEIPLEVVTNPADAKKFGVSVGDALVTAERTGSNGVVGVPEDGADLSNPDDRKSA